MSSALVSSFPTPGPIAATVQVAGARVRITASDRTDTAVTVEPIDPARRTDVKVAGKTKVGFAGGRLAVKTTSSGERDGSVAITIDLPAGSSVVAHLAQSDLRADGRLGDCELHLAAGRVELDRVDALEANVSSGEVVTGLIAGNVKVGGGGDLALRIGDVHGTVVFASSGGRCWIGHAAEDLDLRSGSGDFDIERADNNVTIATGNGAIRVGRMTHGRAELTNGSGNIEVGIAERSAASIDVDSERGAVRNFVASPDDSHPADRKVIVHARTRHGDIVIQRAAPDAQEASVSSTS